MWRATPIRWFSSRYRIEERGRTIGEAGLGSWSERGAVELGGRRMPIRRQGFWHPSFSLTSTDKTLATAQSAGAFRRGFRIVHGDEQYHLDPSSAFSRSFDLTLRGHFLGQVRALSLFGRGARIDLDEKLSPELRLFIFWLVLLAWHRAAASTVAAS